MDYDVSGAVFDAAGQLLGSRTRAVQSAVVLSFHHYYHGRNHQSGLWGVFGLRARGRLCGQHQQPESVDPGRMAEVKIPLTQIHTGPRQRVEACGLAELRAQTWLVIVAMCVSASCLASQANADYTPSDVLNHLMASRKTVTNATFECVWKIFEDGPKSPDGKTRGFVKMGAADLLLGRSWPAPQHTARRAVVARTGRCRRPKSQPRRIAFTMARSWRTQRLIPPGIAMGESPRRPRTPLAILR